MRVRMLYFSHNVYRESNKILSDPPTSFQCSIPWWLGGQWEMLLGWKCEVIRSKIIVTPIIENHNGLSVLSPGSGVLTTGVLEFPHHNIMIIQHFRPGQISQTGILRQGNYKWCILAVIFRTEFHIYSMGLVLCLYSLIKHVLNQSWH